MKTSAFSANLQIKKGERTLNFLLPKSVFFRPKELSYNVNAEKHLNYLLQNVIYLV